MKMGLFQTVWQCLIVYSLAFEDLIYVYGDGNKEMTDQGRVQYQIIKERGALPKYGPCWRAALEHLSEGCRYLSEDTQSDIALHITNCFLDMSGHETYNCELDKKPNLRGICINSMSDRAFNVYTEFYTHTQNICWFLRGQIWHETIAENTLKVGKQLEISAEQQEDLIKVQKESLVIQEKMLIQGRFLEKVLEDVYVSTRAHQELLKLLTQSVTSLQTWIVGEISWIDSIMFNCFASFLILIVSSSQRTLPARLPLFTLLGLNFIFERLICSLYTKYSDKFDTHSLYDNIYSFVWYARYLFTVIALVIVVYVALTFQDILQHNLLMLNAIKEQNSDILNSLEKCRRSKTPLITSTVDFVSEQKSTNHINSTNLDLSVNLKGKPVKSSSFSNNYEEFEREYSVDSSETSGKSFNNSYAKRKFNTHDNKYLLRSQSRHGTPDSRVVY